MIVALSGSRSRTGWKPMWLVRSVNVRERLKPHPGFLWLEVFVDHGDPTDLLPADALDGPASFEDMARQPCAPRVPTASSRKA